MRERSTQRGREAANLAKEIVVQNVSLTCAEDGASGKPLNSEVVAPGEPNLAGQAGGEAKPTFTLPSLADAEAALVELLGRGLQADLIHSPKGGGGHCRPDESG